MRRNKFDEVDVFIVFISLLVIAAFIVFLEFGCSGKTRILDGCRVLKGCTGKCETFQHERVNDYYGKQYYAPVVDDKGGNVRC